MADLTGVKVGDRLRLRQRYKDGPHRQERIEIVHRTTRTQVVTKVVLSSGNRFKHFMNDTGAGRGWPENQYIAELDTSKPDEDNTNADA